MSFKPFLYLFVFLFSVSVYSQNDRIQIVKTFNKELKDFYSQQDSLQKLSENEIKVLQIISQIQEIEHEYLNDHVLKLYYDGVKVVGNDVRDAIKFKLFAIFTQIFHRKRFPNEAIKNAKEAIALAEKLQLNDDLSRYSSFLAINYIRIEQYNNATNVYKKVIEYYEAIPLSINLLALHNNLGIHYYENLKDNDAALFHFQKLYDFPKTLLQGFLLEWSIKDNIALVYMDSGDYVSAKILFKENYTKYENHYNESSINAERWIRAGLQLADVTIKLGDLKTAKKLLTEIEKHLLMLGQYGKDRVKSDLLFLKINARYHKAIGDFNTAYSLLEQRGKLLEEDQIRKAKLERASQFFYRNLGLEASEKSLSDEKKLRIEEGKIAQSQLIILIITIVSILFISILFYMRYRQRLKTNIILKNLNAEKYKRELNKKEFLEKEIAYKKKDLSDFAINIAHNQDWANQLHERLLKIQSLSGRAKGKQMDLLAKDVKSKLQVEGITSAVHDKIELLSNKFYTRLKVDFPELSKTEIRLSTLIRLNLDNNEIAILQNLTIESVYKSRYRLRKKLNLSSDTNLSAFLKDF